MMLLVFTVVLLSVNNLVLSTEIRRWTRSTCRLKTASLRSDISKGHALSIHTNDAKYSGTSSFRRSSISENLSNASSIDPSNPTVESVKSDVVLKFKRSINFRDKLTAYHWSAIFQEIRDNMSSFSVSDTSLLMWCLGTWKLRMNSESIDFKYIKVEEISDKVLIRLGRMRKYLNHEDITLILIGCARIGIRNPDFSKLIFLDILPMKLSDMSEYQVSNVVWSLGKLQVSWDSLPTVLRKQLISTMTASMKYMTPQGLSSLLNGISNMKVSWSNLNIHFRKTLFSCLQNIASQMNEQEISNTFSSLGRLNVEWSSLSVSLQSTLLSSFSRILTPNSKKSVTCKGFTMTLNGLSKMNVEAANLPHDFKRNIINGFIQTRDKLNAQEVANVVYGFSKIRGFISVSNTYQEDIVDKLMMIVQRQINSFTTQGLANTIWGFMLMDFQWQDIPILLKSSIIDTVFVNLSRMTEQELTCTFFALSKLGLNWEEEVNGIFRSSFLNILENELPQMPPSGAIMTLLAFGRLGLSWNSLSSSLQTALSNALTVILQNSNEETVSVVLHGIVLLDVSWLSLKPSLRSAIEDSIIRAYCSQDKYLNEKYSTQLDVLAISEAKEIIASATKAKSSQQKKSSTLNVCEIVSGIPDLSQISNSNHHFHIIQSLGALGCTWSELKFLVRSTLLNTLHNLEDMSERSVTEVFHGLSKMNTPWVDIRPDIKKKLMSALVHISSSLTEQGIAQLVLALSNMNVSWEYDIPAIAKACIRRSIVSQSSLGEHALSTILNGMGKMSRLWDEIHPEVRKTLKTAIVVCHIEGKITPEGVANSIYGLGNMRTKWSALSSSVRLALLTEVSNVLPKCSPTQLINILTGLSRMSIGDWKILPLSVANELEVNLLRIIPQMNDQHFSSLCFALASFGMTWNSKQLPVFILKAIKSRLETLLSSSMSLLGFSTLLHSLARLEIRAFDFNVAVCNMIDSSLQKFLSQEKLTVADVSMIVSSLGRLGWRWESLPNLVSKQLLLKLFFSTSLVKTTTKDMSLVIHGLGSMGLHWSMLSDDVQKVIKLWCDRIAKIGNPSEVSGMLLGLGLLDCSWNSVQPQQRVIIINSLLRISEELSERFQEPSHNAQVNKVWTFDTVGSSHQPLNSQLASVAANIMYGLSLIIFDCTDNKSVEELIPVHKKLLSVASTIGVAKFAKHEREQILIYSNLLEVMYPSLMNDWKQSCRFQGGKDSSILVDGCLVQESVSSHLQQTVVEGISLALARRSFDDLKLKNEYSAFDGLFPVDATVFMNNIPVAFVEIDGPQHFNSGHLRRKDQLKESLYKHKHPHATFTRVRYDQVKHIGVTCVGNEVANFITLFRSHVELLDNNRHDSNQDFSFATRNAQRELSLALDGYYHDPLYRHTHTRSFDFIFADDEEDNS